MFLNEIRNLGDEIQALLGQIPPLLATTPTDTQHRRLLHQQIEAITTTHDRFMKACDRYLAHKNGHGC